MRCRRSFAAAVVPVQHSFLYLFFDSAHLLLQWMHLSAQIAGAMFRMLKWIEACEVSVMKWHLSKLQKCQPATFLDLQLGLSTRQDAYFMWHLPCASVLENYLFCRRAQAELDGLQEEQARMGELGVGISPLQAADLDRRKEKVAKLVKVSFP